MPRTATSPPTRRSLLPLLRLASATVLLPVTLLPIQAARAAQGQAPAPAGIIAPPPASGDPFALGPDSREQPGVPKGEVLHFKFEHSQIFPGTSRDYWIYVPAQYSPDKPACLYVNQDGLQGWHAPTVFDNLIAKGEMPVTIGVFVTPGVVHAADGKTALDRYNRSLEYDGLGDNYARFLIEEVLPDAETKKSSDGRAIHFSHDGKDRAIGGSSSGAIAAFTAAWERPDSFSRVFSVVGTYVGLRGGEIYPTLIRKFEPKPLRVFLEDGENDLNIYGGDWWMANNTMNRALLFSGYEVDHVWGTHGHDGRQGAAIFPEVMRYLWKGWPAPVGSTGPSKNQMLGEILLPGEAWTPGDAGNGSPIGDSRGLVVVSRVKKVYTVERGKDGTGQRITVADLSGRKPRAQTVIDGDQRNIGGITVSPDQTLLYVSDAASHWVWSYQIQPDGSLAYGQKYFWLHAPDDADDAGAGGMCVDSDGRLYVATRMGVQVCDQAGRVNAILPLPQNVPAFTVYFGGEQKDRLTVMTAGPFRSAKMPRTGVGGSMGYVRHLKATGVGGASSPIKPAAPRL